MLSDLPDDVIELILDKCTKICPDCDNYVRYSIKTLKFCIQCKMHVCRYHTQSRFSLDNKICNNCYFWTHGQPSAAYGSHW